MCRREVGGRASSYYDGGDFTPYCVESLLEMLRAETRAPYQSLGLTLEIRGDCSASTLRELAERFATIHAPRVQIRICAPGHPAAIVGSATAPPVFGLDADGRPGSGKPF
jgi:hypothetical protein